MEKKNKIDLEIPIEGMEKPAWALILLSNRELELMTKYVKEGMPHWEAFKEMRKTFPLQRLSEDRL